ncbi:4687_t:CDS:2 [Paraglomus occultum]|uniref:ribonuclease III n=1 Tax=Paraglomus occultum TaxID=144539 RepID=A0A9N9BHN4_9GLOM|nr:4687_t:CDS:2 [Paraglomus occultum]
MKNAKQLEKEENRNIKKIFEIRERNRPLTSLLKNKTGYQKLEDYPQEVDYYLAESAEKKNKLEKEKKEIEKELPNASGTELVKKLQRNNDLETRIKELTKEQQRNIIPNQIFPRDQIVLLRLHSLTEEDRNKGLKLLKKYSPIYYTVYRKKGEKEEVIYVVNCHLNLMVYRLKKISKIIESIKDTENFKQAFTHTSYLNELKLRRSSDSEPSSENNEKPIFSYETLEFLGDSVLNFHTSLFIYHKFPNYAEGQMSKLKQLMVQEDTLACLSKEIGLGEFLQLGMGERKNHGAEKESILADIFESFVAALYLEKGSKMVHRFLSLTVFTWIEGKENMIWDYKSQLQEYCQAHKGRVNYRLKGKKIIREGHQQLFIVEVEVNDGPRTFWESGEGRSKSKAEQQAAAKAIKKLGIEEEKN